MSYRLWSPCHGPNGHEGCGWLAGRLGFVGEARQGQASQGRQDRIQQHHWTRTRHACAGPRSSFKPRCLGNRAALFIKDPLFRALQ